MNPKLNNISSVFILIMILCLTLACGISAPPTSTALEATQTSEIGTEQGEIFSEQGGIIRHANGLQVIIPPQALSRDQKITLETVNIKLDDSSNFQPMGEMVSLSADQDTFDKPITLKIPYEESLLPSGREEGEIHIAFLYEGKWYSLRGEVDPAQNIITVQTVHFSTWVPAIDPIHEATIGLYASAVRCLQTLQDSGNSPKTVEQARIEWLLSLDEAKVQYKALDDATWGELPREYAKEIVLQITEFGVETFFGAKALEVTILGVKAGYLGLIFPAMYLFDVSEAGGEFLAAALKLEIAAQNLQAAHAKEYLALYPKAKTMPEEYARGLIGVCDRASRAPTEDFPPACEWVNILYGTWVSKNNDYVTFERGGQGAYYPQGDRNQSTSFEWTCLENGIFKNLTGGSEYRLDFPDNNSYIMNGDLWRRTTLK